MPYWYTMPLSRESMDQSVLQYFHQWRNDFYRVYINDPLKPVGVIEGHITGNLSGDSGIWKDALCISASEHTGYGMIIFALMAGYPGETGDQCKKDFDSLVRLYLGLKRNNNLMAWAIPENTQIFNDALLSQNIGSLPNSASDGDMDIAYALLLAEKKWPNDTTHVKSYKQIALDMINIGIYNDLISPVTNRILLGDWHAEGIRGAWTPELMFNPYVTRSSDFMIENLKMFKEYADSNKKALFQSAIDECFNIMEAFRVSNNNTGLLSDFITNNYTIGTNGKMVFTNEIIPAPQEIYDALSEPFPINAYSENSCRVPQRLALDYIHTGDQRSETYLTLLQNFINTKISGSLGPIWSNVRDGYWLNGDEMNWGPDKLGSHSGLNALQFASCFISSNVVSNSISLGTGFSYLSSSHASSDPNVEDPYFKDTLSLLNMLMISGNWWSPTNEGAPSTNCPE